MSTSKLVIAATLLLAAGAGSYVTPASCQPLQTSPSAASSDETSAIPDFSQLDKTNKGYLTRSDIPKNVEALMPLRMHFKEADTNENGRLEKGEYATYVATLTHPAQGSGGTSAPAQPQPMH
jgi:hypothetical protein